MNDSYWVMVCDNISEIAEIVMIICIILGVISMAISWLNYCTSNGKKESFEWEMFKKGRAWALRFMIIGVISALVLIFTPNKSYYYDKLLEEYKSNIELSE